VVTIRGLIKAVKLFPILFLLFSCGTTAPVKVLQEEPVTDTTRTIEKQIHLLFAGDIMAHKNNYSFGHYDRIWTDVKDTVSKADLAFANIEAPVAASLPWSTYPNFNMHPDYIQAAIDVGFDVFSLANNHTNDQGLEGIQETRKYFASKKGIYSSGLKAKAKDDFSYAVIHKNGWKILFIAFTEIVNRKDYSSFFNFVPPTGEEHDALFEKLKLLREKNPCDLFVVSVHTNEPEYKEPVTDHQKQLCHNLISKSGADIVWSNHAHRVKSWEVVGEDKNQKGHALIMYANGNTISGQRTNPNFALPDSERDYTGDGLFMNVIVSKTSDGKIEITQLKPDFVTTLITPAGQFVIRLLDDDLSKSLFRAGMHSWSEYIKERKRLMEKIGAIKWQ